MSEQPATVDAVSRREPAAGAEPEAASAGGPAQHYDAVVVGGGIAGLAAAWELTRAGLRPLLIEARGYTGGLVARGLIAGLRNDLGAEGFVVRVDAITQMVDALGLRVVGPSGGGARLFLPPPAGTATAAREAANTDARRPAFATPTGAAAREDPARGWRLHRFLRDAFLGIPADPLAEDVIAVLGAEAAARAARDGQLDGAVGTRPQDPADLASFVRTRMGEAVLDRLVRPIVAGIHSADPADLAADTVAPGLREATARLGSLQAAVGELLARRRARRRGAGAAGVTVAGGLLRLTDSQREAITVAGGEVLTRTGAQWLRPAAQADGTTAGWEVGIAPTTRGATPSAEPIAVGPERVVGTRRVVLACSAGAALRLLAGAPGVDTRVQVPIGSPIARFMLVARAPQLADAPVGSGLLVAPVAPGRAPVGAKALSHLSVKWPWIGDRLQQLHGAKGGDSPAGQVHALRLSYGRPGEPRPQVELADVLADVEVLTGVRIREQDVLDSMLVRWDGTLPPVTPAYRERTRRLLEQVEPLDGLAVTGAWVAGTGIAAVVAHARAQAAGLKEHQ
ncbi:NAD(P)/FAD-dependent oxidoreductase [Actinomyces sp.]|uniref:protoporphyrinogen/coproporphyrinogen oxidase n=1 Tax=Actinomyces sp. TaxID=29317 RepID=UPI0026DD44A1|nr:FAD-dependent oxidoreductase [Actinomyces sp.]MDO4900111.1 FAD-dependent oxidoreductase [Actinomyces sp.]